VKIKFQTVIQASVLMISHSAWQIVLEPVTSAQVKQVGLDKNYGKHFDMCVCGRQSTFWSRSGQSIL